MVPLLFGSHPVLLAHHREMLVTHIVWGLDSLLHLLHPGGCLVPIPTKTLITDFHAHFSLEHSWMIPAHIFIITFSFRAILLYFSFMRFEIVFIHLFVTSSFVCILSGSASLHILHSHLSFHIRCAASDTTIRNSLLLSVVLFPSVLLDLARLHPSIWPRLGLFHFRPLALHSLLMSLQIVSCPVASHCVRMCSMFSVVPHT